MSESERRLVLVVDDDRDQLRLIERFLTRDGFDVLTAEGGRAALGLLARSKPDVILLDVTMPDMTGYQVCSLLQNNRDTAYIPVLFVTARDEAQDRARAFAAGAADYLVKPVSRDALLQSIRKHLETGSRWYTVRAATDLWDETPLPKKYVQFRDALFDRLRVPPDLREGLASLPSGEVYALAEALGLTEPELAQEMAAFFGLPYVESVEPQTLELGVLPTAFCRTNHVVAIHEPVRGDAYVISNPFVWELEQLDLLNRAFRGRPHRLLLTQRRVIAALFYEQSEEREGVRPSEQQPEPGADEVPLEKIPIPAEAVTPVQIVNTLIAHAVRAGASDIHVEPDKSRIRVRFRVDGRMRFVVPLLSASYPGVVGRIKVLCGMDPTESRRPQDGGCAVRVDGREIEVRASTLPGVHGEIVVLRLLGDNVSLHRVGALGLEPDMLRGLRHLLAARQGMLLITGPTGSGKTTTLYAALNHLNTEEVNIITVEDPVESGVEGINQVQVNERAGRSFAVTLRAMLRQDPDIVMVGEIRDVETAEIACRAALTGHLVLSTLHTQDTLGSIARLSDMGIPDYLFSASLNGILAQRLIRRVCEGCAEPYTPPAALLRGFESRFGPAPGAHFRKGRGCARCQRRGTRGRVGVFELLIVDDTLRSRIAQRAPVAALREHVARGGFQTLEEDAYRKACRGLVPPEEVLEMGLSLSLHVDAAELR